MTSSTVALAAGILAGAGAGVFLGRLIARRVKL
jgi:hypothetical protein